MTKWALIVVLVWGAFTAARGGDEESIWSALVFATNQEHPKEPASDLLAFKTKLENVFGYNQFELLSKHRELIDDPNEHWLIPGKDFSLRVDSKKASKSVY